MTSQERRSQFAALYEANRADLFAYIVRSVREENTALDILQDCFFNFVRMFQERPLPPDDRQCRMYIFKIARNLIINHSRTSYVSKVDLVEQYSSVEWSRMDQREPTPEEAVVESMEQEEQERLLQTLLADLPDEQRQAVLLRYTGQMKLEQIAEVLGVSISTASRLLKRAERAMEHASRQLREESR